MFEGKKVVVTGGAGFIGSHVVDELMACGAEVTVIDNFSTGRKEFISRHLSSKSFKLVKADLLQPETFSKHLGGAFAVFHLAANSDMKISTKDTRTDLEQGPVATYNLLEQMRKKDVKNFVFSSSSAIYGESLESPVKETDGPALPISLYGGSKLGCEGLASAYAGTFGFSCVVFRFANVVGPRSTHGVIYDFCRKLRSNPKSLEVLGDGNQCKSYVLASECAQAFVFGASRALGSLSSKTEVFNISNSDWTSVKDIAHIVILSSGLPSVQVHYTGGSRGWPGDVPKVLLDGSRLAKLGWKPSLNSTQSVRVAAQKVWAESASSASA